MIYVEWERDSDKKFWLPRRDVLLPVVNALQEALFEDKYDILGVSLPPGSGKSTLKCFTLAMLLGKYPDKHNIDTGYSDKMAHSTFDGVMEILSDKYEYLWSDVFPEAGSIITNAKELTIDIGKKHRFSTLTCRSIDGSLTGSTRADMAVFCDDLVSGFEEALSKDRLDRKYGSYTSNLLTRTKIGTKVIHIGTRWSVHDVIGRVERQHLGDPRVKFFVIPALDENGHSNFNYKYNVGFDDKYFYEIKESMDEVSFKALYQNEPIEREGLLYFPQDLQRYYELPNTEPDAIVAVCDVADGGGDDLVMPIFYQYGNEHYLVDVVCSNALPDVTNPMCAELLIKHNVQRCQFESNAMGLRAADRVQELVENKCKCRITKKRTTGNKETKIIVQSEWVKANVLFKDEKVIERGSMYYWFMNKLCSYTQTGRNKHDDVPDAMAQYALFATTITGGKATVMQRFW